jgi:predicted transcriptional regulator of viral defense system
MKPAEEVVRDIATRYTEQTGECWSHIPFCTDLKEIITAAIEAKRKRLKAAEKWMRHLDGCALGSRIAYNSMTKSFCTCGLDDFRKEK